MTDLPGSWSESTIREIADTCLGKMLDKAKNRGRPLPYLRNINVRWGAFDLADLATMPFEEDEGERYGLRSGDLVVCEGGEPGRCAVWDGQVENMRFQKALHRVRPSPAVTSAWLARWIRHMADSGALSEYFTGTGIAHLTVDSLSRVPVPVAPETEQRRIVAKLDALQSHTRLAREALAAIPALLDHYRQSVLAAAFRGELTAGWRASKAARTTVSSALTSVETPPRPARYGSRSEVVSSGDYALAVGNPGTELPDGWQWVPLVDIARLESGHTPSRQHPEWWGGKTPWVSIPDARDNHGRIIEKTTVNTNELGLANSAARLLPAGTVCLCRTAASIGYVTVFGRPMATSQDFVNWTCTSAIDPHWLKFLLMAEYQALLRFSKGSAHKTIYFPEVVSFHVGLPPIEEQRQIVNNVERQMRRIDDLAVIVRTMLANCSSLDQATLATAFRGELVPQDPADEPASVLLDRIRAARTQAGDAPRTRRPRAPAAPAPARAAEPATPYRAATTDAYATILVALRAKGSLASSDAQAATGLAAAGVRPLLQRLVAEGAAKVEGQKRGTRYVARKGSSR